MQLDPATRIALEQLYSLSCRLSWCSRACWASPARCRRGPSAVRALVVDAALTMLLQ